MVRALLEMRIKAGQEHVFVEVWRGVARLAAAAPGNLRQALLRDPNDSSRFIVSSDWRSLQDFRAFERSPEQDAATAPLRQLRAKASMSIFEVTASFEGKVETVEEKLNDQTESDRRSNPARQ